MDWSENNLCLKCNGGENLLVCSENGCPIAIHKGCMRIPARFNDAGNYYCPYCVYKHAVAELRQAREIALARKKDLLIFLDKGLTGGVNHLEEIKRAESIGRTKLKFGGDVNIRRSDNDKNDAVADQSVNPADVEHKISDTEEDKTSAGSKGQEPSLKMHKEQKNINEEEEEEEEEEDDDDEGNIQDEEEENEEDIQDEEEEKDNAMEEDDDTSATSSGEGHSLKMHEQEIEGEKIQEEDYETSSASTGQNMALTLSGRSKRDPKKRKLIVRHSELVPKQNKRVRKDDEKKQTSPTLDSPSKSSAQRTENGIDEKDDASRRSKRPQKPSIKLTDGKHGHGKHETILWSKEEEEKLKEGVEMFSGKGSKKISWKEILELGPNVFDQTRTPSDLKNKWRRMSRKENKRQT